jgi:Sulfotransferase family
MRLPNLIIAGVGKAGTTSLFSYLAQHPEICASRIKEANYFTPLRHGEELEPLEAYAAHFSHCGRERYLMESTPVYFYGGRRLITTLKSTLPDARVIVTLRDPTPRLWSYFRFMKTRLKLEREESLDEYLEVALQLRERGADRRREHNAYWAFSSGFYGDYIPDWFEAFGSAFRVVFFEDLVEDPRSVVKGLCDWLGIDPEPTERFDYSPENQTVLYRSRTFQRMALAVNSRAEGLLRAHPAVKAPLRRLYYFFNRDHDDRAGLGHDARQRLDAIYAASNEKLAAQLAAEGYTELPSWLQATGRATGERVS